MNMKFCNKCNKDKPVTDFYERGDGRLYGCCKECAKLISKGFYIENKEWKKRDRTNARRDHLKFYYGLTLEEYDRMYNAQNGLCKICGKHVEHRKLCVDHDHDTNKVRGLLCRSCNIRLGVIESASKKGLFQKMLDYLKGIK
jgi:hypothetical protein